MEKGKLLLTGLVSTVTELLEDLSAYEHMNDVSVQAAREAGKCMIATYCV